MLRVGAFAMPLAFLPGIVDEFVLPKLLLARLLVVVLGVLLVTRWSMQRAITWRRTPLDVPLLAFIASAMVSTVFAVNTIVAIFGTYDRWEGLLTICTYAFVYWLAVQFVSGETDARALTWSLLVSGYVIAVAAVLQAAFGLLGGGYFHYGANGPIRADVTLANPDFLGIFLAMLLPVAFAKLISRRPLMTRALAANMVVVFTLGLLLTYTRAAWLAALVGLVVVLSLRQGRFRVWPLAALAVVVIALVGVLAVARAGNGQGGLAEGLYARVTSIADVTAGTEGERLRTWSDTLPLIASRPIVGYGPDTFGLVYPTFQSTNTSGTLWDKPHEEALGVAATQGVIGLLAYLWLLVAFARAFWQGRKRRGAVALFGGWVAYEFATQVNFSYIPASMPFWLMAAAAIVTWAPPNEVVRIAKFELRQSVPALGAIGLASLLVLVLGVAMPFLADSAYYSAQAATDRQVARSQIAQAQALAPFEAAYATQAGDLALDLDVNDNPSADADWSAALQAYQMAADLGSYAPETFRHLAITYDHFGDHADAIAAAKRALELDRFDPDSKALLAKLTAP